MQRIRRFRPSVATVIACVALFMALGGVGYAAATIDGKTIQNRTIAGKKMKKNSVGGTAVKESKLGQVPSAAKADSATSAQSAASAQDAVNAQNAVNAQSAQTAQSASSVGPNGVASAALQDDAVTAAKLGNTALRTDSIAIAAGDSESISESCQPGERMLTGGGFWGGGDPDADAADLHVVHTYPSGNGWLVRGYNGTGGAYTLNVRVVCLAN